ncbi:MAG: molybdopterin-dependent oxidoreductase [Elusimicrobia bacterium]|nr:molybdopterin-dependent oxidoreductase [Elusimicrobiota bacterium]
MNITIDGRRFEVQGTKTVLEIAKENGIYIPALCSHPRLAPYAACRLCVVEIKGRSGLHPSCNTYPEDGMAVVTDSEPLRLQRLKTLELILSEHPNACLICAEKEKCEDHKASIRKVGEVTGCVFCPSNRRCELQEVVGKLKLDSLPYDSVYRGLEVRRGDPFFIQDYNLCILCGRCVRVCREVRGAAVISIVRRGSEAVVGTALDRKLMDAGCQFCGACVDVCPTGALAERASRHEPPPDAVAKTVCPHCGVGCRLDVETLQGRIVASRPDASLEAPAVNRGQACVRGRFTLRDTVASPRRLRRPMIRKDGKLVETGWDAALAFVAAGLKPRAGKAALVASSQLSLEDLFVLDLFSRSALKADGIVASLGPSILDELSAAAGGLKAPPRASLADVAKARTILVLGENVAVSHPVAWVEILDAVRRGGRLLVVGPKDDPMSRHASLSLKVRPGGEPALLAAVSKALLEKGAPSGLKGFDAFKRSLDGSSLAACCESAGVKEEDCRRLAGALAEGGPAALVFGQGLCGAPWTKACVSNLWNLALQTGAALFPLAEESDSFGAWLLMRRRAAGAPDLAAVLRAAAAGTLKALYLAGPASLPAKHGLEFLVVQDSFMNDSCQAADAVLPAATFAETEGNWVNLEGRAQKSMKAIEPLGEAKPDWWIASRLAGLMGADGCAFEGADRIKERIDEEGLLAVREEGGQGFLAACPPGGPADKAGEYPLVLLGEYSPDYYRTLALCQTSPDFKVLRDPGWIKIGPEDAAGAGLQEGATAHVESSSGTMEAVVRITAGMPKGVAAVSRLDHGLSGFSRLSAAAAGSARVKITRVN